MAGLVTDFAAAGDGIVQSTSSASASFGQRVYYAGYLLSTLGNGDIVAATPGWRIATVLASLNGLLALTLAITFLVPVVSGVVQRRTLAAQIAGLGGSPQRVLQRAWDGHDFSALEPHLTGLVPALHTLTQRQLAYPVLHYFHSTERHAAIAPLVAGLDEALLVIEAGAAQRGLSDVTLHSTRSAITHLLSLVRRAYVVPAASPPPPDLQWCGRLGVDVGDVDAFLAAVDRESRRRRLLRGFVESDGWQWDDVLSSPGSAGGS